MELFENWQDSKNTLLEGLDSNKRAIVGQLLENQKKQVLKENASAGVTAAADIAGFRKILIPMIRRIIPGTIASELVGVQPMQGPVGLVYSLRHTFKEAATGTNFAGAPVTIAAGSEAFGNSHYSFPSNPVYDFYSGQVGAATGQLAGASGIGPASPGDIDDGSVVPASGSAWGAATGFSALEGCTIGGSGGSIESSGGRKMGIEIVSQAVESGTRKLQAGWTIEAMQDANSQHGIDLENEMTQALSAEIVQEIDAEIIKDLLTLAGTAAVFEGSVGGPVGNTYAPAYVGDRLANLQAMINYVANEIGRKTRRSSGNFIVVSPMILSVLQTASTSVFAPAVKGSFKGPNNTYLAGTMNGIIKVYSYLWNDVQSTDVGGTGDDTILVGYKGGNGETDSGYFYCPYIPLMSSGVVVNPLTYDPQISLMTRYGKTFFNDPTTSLGNSSDYYGKINVNDLSFA